MKTLVFSLLLLITGCSPNYEPLPLLTPQMCTVVKVWGGVTELNGRREPDHIDIVYGSKVYRVEGPFPYKTFKSGDDIMVLMPK